MLHPGVVWLTPRTTDEAVRQARLAFAADSLGPVDLGPLTPSAARARDRLDQMMNTELHPTEPASRTAKDTTPVDASASPARPDARPRIDGKFLRVGDRRFWVKGATYGTFAPDDEGHNFPPPPRVEEDFAAMAAQGFNSVRVYTPPPVWLLDAAHRHGLKVMVGLPWEQHIAFLDDSDRARAIESRVREGVGACRGHPAILCFAIGNEIPAAICRWHGARRIERFLHRLFEAVKDEDPGALVTYVNFPSTEYLRLPFLDFVTFNVYLEKRETLAAYLARLQNIAGDRPLVMAEIGLDSQRNGLDAQAATLDWQVRTIFAAGCSGAYVFAWTDEWWRGGHDIPDWDFGLVTRDRRPKPALASVARAFREIPFRPRTDLPRFTVIICTYNGARTLRDAFAGLAKVDYPDFEVVLVDDGSTDDSAAIAAAHGARVISTENRGLSSARNTGMDAATGELIVYLDDDAWPDPLWLRYLAETFLEGDHACAGGPNLSPPGTGEIADCVDNAPGGPVHVLIDDKRAEHVPGCNMAFRKSRLQAIGGFDPQFRAAGDDVDVCWRLLERGWTIGFSPAALVWHHRRKTIGAYWRQQRGYGKAEALLERKWPEKYNAVGHVAWGGRLYGKGLTRVFGRMSRIYHGAWGSASFQARYDTPPSLLRVLPTMPEWYLILAFIGVLVSLSVLWPRLLWVAPVFGSALALTLAQAALSAAQARFSTPVKGWRKLRLRGVTAWLHFIQPVARLWGRIRHGLHAGRLRLPMRMAFPIARTVTLWRERWTMPEDMIRELSHELRKQGAVIVSGGDYDRWDFAVRAGVLGGAQVLMTVEEHGSGKQLFRFMVWPKYSWEAIATVVVLGALAAGAIFDRAVGAYLVFTALTAVFAFRLLQEGSVALAAVERALSEPMDADFKKRS
jgi:GT2 family glycosyltransferase